MVLSFHLLLNQKIRGKTINNGSCIMKVIIGIIFYAIIAYITCPRKENRDFEEGAVVMYIIVPVVILAIYLICNN